MHSFGTIPGMIRVVLTVLMLVDGRGIITWVTASLDHVSIWIMQKLDNHLHMLVQVTIRRRLSVRQVIQRSRIATTPNSLNKN
jgi:hypothetical protein